MSERTLEKKSLEFLCCIINPSSKLYVEVISLTNQPFILLLALIIWLLIADSDSDFCDKMVCSLKIYHTMRCSTVSPKQILAISWVLICVTWKVLSLVFLVQ